MGSVPSAVTILRRLHVEQKSEVQVINLKIIMGNIYAYYETISRALDSTHDIVSQWMEDHKLTLGKDKSFLRLFAMTMRAKGCVDWFNPSVEGETFLLSKFGNPFLNQFFQIIRNYFGSIALKRTCPWQSTC